MSTSPTSCDKPLETLNQILWALGDRITESRQRVFFFENLTQNESGAIVSALQHLGYLPPKCNQSVWFTIEMPKAMRRFNEDNGIYSPSSSIVISYGFISALRKALIMSFQYGFSAKEQTTPEEPEEHSVAGRRLGV